MSLCSTPLPGQAFRLPTAALPAVFQGPLPLLAPPDLAPILLLHQWSAHCVLPPAFLWPPTGPLCVPHPDVLDLPGKPSSQHHQGQSLLSSHKNRRRKWRPRWGKRLSEVTQRGGSGVTQGLAWGAGGAVLFRQACRPTVPSTVWLTSPA